MGRLTMSISATESYVLVRVAGEADTTVSVQMHELLAAVLAGMRHLVVDMSGLRFVDVACVRVLVRACRAAEDAGGTLVLVAPQPIVARMLELCRADQLIAVYRNVTEVPPRRVLPTEEAAAAGPRSDYEYPVWLSGPG
jgi:anti-sigma B factor antagonist